MSNHLGTARGSAGMSVDAAIASLNDALGAHDAALANPSGALTIGATNTRTLTAAEMIGSSIFTFTAGGATAACTVNVPALNAAGATLRRGFFGVKNDTGFDLTVQKSGQGETPPSLSAGQRSILCYDGDNVFIAVPLGVVGADGVSAGLKYSFSTTTTMADPGAGNARLNNADLSLVTAAALSDQSADTGNPNVSDRLATWDDSTSAKKGDLYVTKRSAPENFAHYELTAATDNVGFWQFTLIYRDHAGSFSASDALDWLLVPKGDQGAGSTVAVESDGAGVLAAASTLNFSSDFAAVDAGAGQANVALANPTSGAWTTTNPVPTASSGTFTTVSSIVRSKKVGRTVHIQIQITITTVGTASGGVLLTLPYQAATGIVQMLSGRENGTGLAIYGHINSGTTQVTLRRYDNAQLTTNGYVLAIGGTYEAAA